MAEIKPLKGWRYNQSLQNDIGQLTSPLFDVISDRQRNELYHNPINSIHLSVPMGDSPVNATAKTVQNWKKEGIIVQDQLPGIYVYYQYFNLPGHANQLVRKGIIANVKIHPWKDRVILHHEDTMSKSVNDRMEILEGTHMNVSPTHGLYEDLTHEIERYTDEAIKAPLCETEDYQGVRDVFSVIHDKKVIENIIKLLRNKPIILADGHHRYEGSLLYQQKRKDANPEHTGDEAFNYHMMYLTNTESTDLRILPTHRLVNGLPNVNEATLLEKLSAYFTIKTIANPVDLNDIIVGKKWAFGLLIGQNAYKIILKPEKINLIDWEMPTVVKELDLTILHYFVFQLCFGLDREDQRNGHHLTFERNFAVCLQQVNAQKAQMAFITQEISIETVKKVCQSGYTLPQKSTYFYPKVITGFLFSSIDQDEFQTPFTFSK